MIRSITVNASPLNDPPMTVTIEFERLSDWTLFRNCLGGYHCTVADSIPKNGTTPEKRERLRSMLLDLYNKANNQQVR